MTFKKEGQPDFLETVSRHEMTIEFQNDVYRSILFKRPDTYSMHFRLTTWSGHLCISGDMGTFVFARVRDMFKFFRHEEINPRYWSEKVQSISQHGGLYTFNEERTNAWFADYIRDYSTEERSDYYDHITCESKDDLSRVLSEVCSIQGCQDVYSDISEHVYQDYSYQFLWCCQAIVWGIEQFDNEIAVANPQSGAWQPIATAPKIEDNPILGIDAYDTYAILEFNSKRGEFYDPVDECGVGIGIPIKWQPLPTPPAREGEE